MPESFEVSPDPVNRIYTHDGCGGQIRLTAAVDVLWQFDCTGCDGRWIGRRVEGGAWRMTEVSNA